MSLRRSGERIAFALGLGTIALLPAWDAVNSLPAPDRTAMPLAWVAGGTALLAAAVLLALVNRPHHRGVWWLLRVPLLLLLLLLVVDTGVFLYAHARAMTVVLAAEHYAQVRLLAIALLALAAAALLFLAWRLGLRRLAGAAASGVAMLAALPLVYLVSYAMGRGGATRADAAAPPARNVTVVLILDELDSSVIDRRIDHLPNLRRLRDSALSAGAMYSPANATSESLPGMLTGEDYAYTSYTRNEIHVQAVGAEAWGRMSKLPSLFSDAKAAGGRVDVVGWHLPYCEVFTGLQSCWDDAAFRAPGARVPLLEWMRGHSHLMGLWDNRKLNRLKGDVRAYSRAFFGAPVNYRLRRIGEIVNAQSVRLLELLAQGRSELVFAHLACPHPPAVDPALVDSLDVFQAYDFNLEYCDRLLGQVQQALAQRRPAQTSTLIVTSDHWFRGLDWQDQGSPSVVPSGRRPVPFYVQQDERKGSAYSTAKVATTRVLRPLLAAAAKKPFDYAEARRLIEAAGDGTTRLRTF